VSRNRDLEQGMAVSSELLKRMLSSGEEQIGKLASALMGNEKFVSAMQGAVARTLEAKGLLDRQTVSALNAMHVPTRQDMTKLNDRLDELERIFEELSRKVDGIASHLTSKH
jgi:polyhydroxyalkanoate synthesis regulator phasin